MRFKETKTLDEMIIHLEENKNVIFNDITKDEAKEILYKHGYINVVTPFKFKFAKRFKYNNENLDPYKDKDGVHVYENKVDFKQYYDSYIEEREKYHNILTNISKFETYFKSISSYEILNHYKSNKSPIDCINDLKVFITKVKFNASISPWINKNFTLDSLDNWKNKLMDMIDRKHSVFVWFDHLNLSQWEIMFAGLDTQLQTNIFHELRKLNMTFNTTNIYDFLVRFNAVIDFRNIIAHNNSTTVLVRYRKPQRNIIRHNYERRKYIKILKMLSQTKF